MRPVRFVAWLAAWMFCATWIESAHAQQFELDFADPIRVGTPNATASATVSAQLELVPDSDEVLLSITVETTPDAWTYAMGGTYSGKTVVTIDDANIVGLTAVDETFTPDHAPKHEVDPATMEEVDKFVGGVTWTRRYRRIDGGIEPQITGQIVFNLCTAANCQRETENFTATIAADGDTPVVEEIGSPGAGDPALSSDLSMGYLVVPTARNGDAQPFQLQLQLAEVAEDEWVLTILMQLQEGWRTYAIEPTPDQNENPTDIQFSEVAGLEAMGELEVGSPVTLHHGVTGTTANVHEGQAVWRQRFQRVGTDPIGLKGAISYQVCENVCIFGNTDFSLGSLQSPADIATATAPTLPVPAQVQLAIERPEAESAGNLALQLLLAFLGGLILNVMPCVLPVIAIKILSFVQQAGESRTKVLALNFSYTAGVLTVFLILATLAMTISMGWGAQFQNVIFTMSMASVVFVMALSLLGVFEIPIPGFAGSGEQREGPAGAYMTGIVATLLGVPCTGPLMAAVFAWALQQPTLVTYAVFTSMGLGMASPYFVAGFFPGIVNLLPKPGAWMEKFKQFLGFILMATVIWLIYVIPGQYQITFMVFLLGLAMGFWMIGGMYGPTSPARQKWQVRISALLCVAVVSASAWFLQFGFGYHLPWEPFSERRMAELVEEGRPVLIDFTANWCQICKTNEKFALNRAGTLNFVEEHNVATLMADYTDFSPEIQKWLHKFQESDSVPLTVILPPQRPGQPLEPVTITGLYSQATLLEQLELAIVAREQTASADASSHEVSQR